MVVGVFGLPGMGKTTMLTAAAQHSLNGRSFLGLPAHDKVYTNFECPGCYRLDFDKLGKYKFENALIIIDEIMLYADSRDFKSFSDDLKYFFSHQRHVNLDILWCSQMYDDCDKKIRGLTDHYYLLEKMSILPISIVKPILRKLGAMNNKFCDTIYMGAPISWTFIWRPKYYKMFDSFTYKDLPPVDNVPWLPDTMGQFKREKRSARKQAKQQLRRMKREAKRQNHGSRDWLDLIPDSEKL